MSTKARLSLFEGTGLELEYMIVDRDSLDVRPISQILLADSAGQAVSDVPRGEMTWSNELSHHVVEVKTTHPANTIQHLAAAFQAEVREMNRRLSTSNAMLLPTAMHPWMNPDLESKLWPYEYHEVYRTYDRVFDCGGHGWSNLQSMHLNFSFQGDEEFGKLHAAIRLILPVLPGLAASSPILDHRLGPALDNRLRVYCENSKRIPSIMGHVIPEPVFSEERYRHTILEPMYRDIAPLDPEGILQNEFLNSRGAIARFDRGSIEIRVIDLQECPAADIAIAALTITALKAMVEQEWSSTHSQQQIETASLRKIFDDAVTEGERAWIEDARFLQLWGLKANKILLADFWRELYARCQTAVREIATDADREIQVLLEAGPLARRILAWMNEKTDQRQLKFVYERLAQCLETGRMLRSPADE